MNTKAKLRDDLRRAQSDASLRKSLLDNAQLLKRTFGWSALVWALWLLGRTAFEEWQGFSHHSGMTWLGLIFTTMAYEKFADRVAMLESMEEPTKQMQRAGR